MTDQTKGSSRGGRLGLGPPWPAILVACGLLALGVWFYFCIVMRAGAGDAGPVAQLWGVRGDAMGPFAALFNAGALLAALWAVHLQRQELHETREEMKAQRLEFERTAKAQEALAGSQKRLADAQEEASRAHEVAIVADLRSEHARRYHSVTTLVVAIAQLRTAIEVERHRSANGNFGQTLAKEIERLEARLKVESVGVTDAEQMMRITDDIREADEARRRAARRA